MKSFLNSNDTKPLKFINGVLHLSASCQHLEIIGLFLWAIPKHTVRETLTFIIGVY